jgi:hypothetical protein
VMTTKRSRAETMTSKTSTLTRTGARPPPPKWTTSVIQESPGCCPT